MSRCSCADHSGGKNVCKYAINKSSFCRLWACARDKAGKRATLEESNLGVNASWFFSSRFCWLSGSECKHGLMNYLSLPHSEAVVSPASLIKPGLIVSMVGEGGPFVWANRPKTRLADQRLVCWGLPMLCRCRKCTQI